MWIKCEFTVYGFTRGKACSFDGQSRARAFCITLMVIAQHLTARRTRPKLSQTVSVCRAASSVLDIYRHVSVRGTLTLYPFSFVVTVMFVCVAARDVGRMLKCIVGMDLLWCGEKHN